MHKLYSTFPGGWFGFGLLLVRVALGGTLIVQGFAYLSELPDLTLRAWAMCVALLGSGSALLVGLLTPVACALALLGIFSISLSWLPAPNLNFFHGNLFDIDALLIAFATVFLGPGAFSLDARLFGRRKIIIPRASLMPKS